MHVCPQCDCQMVQPVNWVERAQGCWWVELRCPECGWGDAGLFDQSTVDAYDKVIDRGMRDLMQDLRDLTRVNMEDEIERFVVALDAGGVLPEDF